MRRRFLATCGLLLLAGCASIPVSHEPLAAPEQEALLRGLSGFRLDGRAGVQAGEEGFNVPVLSWRQHAAESQLKLSGSLGVGGLVLVYDPPALRVTTSRGEVLEDAEAEQAVAAQIGFVPPFGALRYWVLGLAAPGEPPVEQVADATGRVTDMTQLQWHLHYDRWTEVATRSGAVHLARRLTATRADLRLTLFVDRWKLQSGN